MKPLHRRIVLYGMLALCAVGAAWMSRASERRSDEVVAPSTLRTRAQVPTDKATDFATPSKLHEIERPLAFIDEANPFASTQWIGTQSPVAPQVLVAAPVVQQPPTAPQLPFVFAGRLEETPGRWIVYLAKGDQSFAVTKGEVFDTDYRFDGVEDGHLIIVYLPLAAKQYLPIVKDEQFQ